MREKNLTLLLRRLMKIQIYNNFISFFQRIIKLIRSCPLCFFRLGNFFYFVLFLDEPRVLFSFQ